MAAEEKDPVSRLVAGVTPYDVLGYLAPGGAAILCCFFFEFWLRRVDGVQPDDALLPTYSLFSELVHGLTSSSWAIAAIFLVIAIGGIYVVGHVVASVSAVLIERMLVQHGHGYPFNRYLNVPDAPTTPVTRSFYRALFFWTNVYLMLRYTEVAIGIQWPGLPIGAWVAHIAKGLAWEIVILGSLKVLLSTDAATKHVANGRYQNAAVNALARVIAWAAAPYNAIINPFDRAIGLHTPLPEPLRERYFKAMKSRFGLLPGDWGSEAYWLSYIQVRSCGPWLSEPAENWLRLYAFARNLSAAFYVAFLYGYAVLAWNTSAIIANEAESIAIWIPVGFFFGSMIMLGRYYYLYASYYTKFIVRAFLYSLHGDLRVGDAEHAKAVA